MDVCKVFCYSLSSITVFPTLEFFCRMDAAYLCQGQGRAQALGKAVALLGDACFPEETRCR